jgi:hypothetical protein
VYVPAKRLPSAAEICNVCGAVPLLGATDSHEESLLAVKLRLPPPVFVTLTEEAAGFVPLPCVALNAMLVADTDNAGTGVGAATLNVTVMVDGEP